MIDVDVVAICRSQACAVLDDGTIIHFDQMFDTFGDLTDDVAEAASATAPLADGRWLVIYLNAFANVARH